MKKTLILLMGLFLLITPHAYAHVVNENTIFDDIEFSEAKDEILVLRGMNIIPYESGPQVFRPQDPLTKAELAFWVGAFHGFGGSGVKKETVQKRAVEAGLIDGIEGTATYADVNHAYFDGQANFEVDPATQLTRADFAIIIGKFLTFEHKGQTLYDRAGLTTGPAGLIEKVDAKGYQMTVNGEAYRIAGHAKLLYGPVQLDQWQGLDLAESWIRKNSQGRQEVQILIAQNEEAQLEELEEEVEELEEEPVEEEPATEDEADEESQIDTDIANEQLTNEAPERSFPIVLVIGGALLLLILGWLFFKRKKV